MDIKEIATSPANWLLGLAAGALLGVWWNRMTPTTSNVTLIAGLVCLAISLAIHPSLRTSPAIVRMLWVIGPTCSVALIAYYFLWASIDQAPKPILQAPNVTVNSTTGTKGDIEALTSKLDPKLLHERYPLGYAVFDIDELTSAVPYRSLVNNYDIDWTTARYTQSAGRYELQLPQIRRKGESKYFGEAKTGGALGSIGKWSGGPIFRDGDRLIMMDGEVVGFRANGAVFVVGFVDMGPASPKRP